MDTHSFLYFGDAVSHIVRAREFFDSQRPGFHNIGTVWLPLPHLFLIPFVAIDALFYSGIAGSVVGIPCLVGTSILLFLIVRNITGSPRIALFSGCLFGLNPNVIYMALTPMTELISIFLITLSGYLLLRWLQDDDEYWLWACAAIVALASLCRYEAWFLVPFISPVIIVRRRLLWHRSDRRGVVRSIIIAALCWTGIAFWICWNKFEYGDPFKFAHWTYSATQGSTFGNEQQIPFDAFLIFGKALLFIFGPFILIIASGVFFRSHLAHSKRIPRIILLLFFGLPAVFALVAILAGFVQVDQWRWNWRYVLTAGLFLSVAGGIGLSEFCYYVKSKITRVLVVVCLLAMPLVQIALPSVGVATFDDAKRSSSDETQFGIALGEQLHQIYTGGSIALLTGFGQAQRIMISSGLPLKQFHIIYNSTEGDILGSLQHSEYYIVIGKDRTPESEKYVNDWLLRKNELLIHYNVRCENSHYIFLERKPVD